MRFFIFLLITSSLIACQRNSRQTGDAQINPSAALYSLDGTERQVEYEALYLTSETKVENLDASDLEQDIKRTSKYLFGPLTTRQWGAVQKGEKVQAHLEKAFLKNGVIAVPYTYKATWLIGRHLLKDPKFSIPVPYSTDLLETEKWQKCTDSQEGHNGWDMFWYFWDPTRWGCDHKEGVHYQQIKPVLSSVETAQTTLSFPEYRKMIRWENGKPTLSMTFAFGYVEDAEEPNPFQDGDYGMGQFQKFHRKLQRTLLPLGFKETAVSQKEYGGSSDLRIGALFTGLKDGVEMRVRIVASGGIDQMDLFAHSYAKDHEGFFAWFGHSRVGSGFDAFQFQQILAHDPKTFTLTPDYQLVYWAGCNSYSYYTMPFFTMKAGINPKFDPKGTKGLDIISNGLPSLFAFNADNADILLKALLNFEKPTSYQEIVKSLEDRAQSWNYEVLVNVLGDEDNE